MNFWDYQARKTKGRRVTTPPLADPPPVLVHSKLEQDLEPTIEVTEQDLSDTIIGRIRVDLRKKWSGTR